MSREPETCTVELTTGSFVHLAHKPSIPASARRLYEQQREDARRDSDLEAPSPLERFQRVTGPGITGWRECYLDVTQIVAVYPVSARPEYPMVYSILAAGGFVPQGV